MLDSVKIGIAEVYEDIPFALEAFVVPLTIITQLLRSAPQLQSRLPLT